MDLQLVVSAPGSSGSRNTGSTTGEADSSLGLQAPVIQPAEAAAAAAPATDENSSSGGSSSGDSEVHAATSAVNAAAPAAGCSLFATPWTQQQVFDGLDTCCMALTIATFTLAAVLCAATLNIEGLAWAGVLMLGFIIAAPVGVGSLILARNHWLVVALRYCLSVAALQRDSGMSFSGVHSKALRLLLCGLSSCLLMLVGFVVAFYLTACYVVTAVLSVPLLDVVLLVSLVPRFRKRFISQDLVFLESYKPARLLVSATLQALPLAAVSLLLLVAAHAPHTTLEQQQQQLLPAQSSNSSSNISSVPGNASAAAAAGPPGSRQGSARRLLLLPPPPVQQQYAPPAVAVSSSSSNVIHSRDSSSYHTQYASSAHNMHSRVLMTHGSVMRRRLAAAAAEAPSPPQPPPPSSSSSSSSSEHHAAPPAPLPPPPGPPATSPVPTRLAWTPEALSKALAVALNRSGHMAAVGSSSSSSNSPPSTVPSADPGFGDGGVLPTVEVIANGRQGGDLQLTLVVPPVTGAAAAAAAAATEENGSSSSSSSSSSSRAAGEGRAFIGLSGTMQFKSGSSPYSSGAGGWISATSHNSFVITVPAWGVITDSAQQLPTGLLYAGVVIGCLDAALVLALMLLGCKSARVGFWRQLGLTLRLKGGFRLPDFVATEALSHMFKDGGRRLHFSHVWYWTHPGDSGKLPLVPRYLFPPDGGWLVPGQMCHLAALAYDSLANSSSSSNSTVEVLELEHASSEDMAVLLRGGLERLQGLKGLHLNWCTLGPRALPHQLLHCKTLKTLMLNRCELSGCGSALLKTLLSSPDCPLTSLAVIKCQMSHHSVKAVAQGLGLNSSLTSLKFTGNAGGKIAALAFATAIQNNKTLQHLNLSFNKLCPSGGDALGHALVAAHKSRMGAAAAEAGSSSSSSSSSNGGGLQRLVVQRKEVGGAGLRSLVQALRRCTGYSGSLTLRVLRGPPAAAAAQGAGDVGAMAPCVLQLVELPVVFVSHEDQEVLISESWLNGVLELTQQQQQQLGAAASAAAPAPVIVEEIGSRPGTACSSSSNSSSSSSCSSNSSSSSSSSNMALAAAAEAAAAAAVEEHHAVISAVQAAATDAVAQAQPDQNLVSSSSSSTDHSVGCLVSASSSSKPAANSSSSSSGNKLGLNTSALQLEPCSSIATDGPTSLGSTADCIPLQSIAAAAAAAVADDTSRGQIGSCPMLIFLSQNDPCDSLAAAVKNIEGLTTADASGLPLGNKGVKAVANALSEAAALQQLLLRDTGVLEDGATALAAALITRANAAARWAATGSSSNGNSAAAAAGGGNEQQQRHRRTNSSSNRHRRGSSSSGVAAAEDAVAAAAADQRHPAAAAGPHDRPPPPAAAAVQLGPTAIPTAAAAAPPPPPPPTTTTVIVEVGRLSTAVTERPVTPCKLQVLDLSHNTICDAGAAALAAAVQGGACPDLQLLSMMDNRYPFDWPTILQLQRLETLKPGLRVQLGAPSTWCENPRAISRAARYPGSSSSSSTVGVSHDGSSSSDASSTSSEDYCGVCLDAPNRLHIRSCSHRLCIDCYKQLVKTAASSSSSSNRHAQQGAKSGCPACPFCRTPMTGFVYAAWVEQQQQQQRSGD